MESNNREGKNERSINEAKEEKLVGEQRRTR